MDASELKQLEHDIRTIKNETIAESITAERLGSVLERIVNQIIDINERISNIEKSIS